MYYVSSMPTADGKYFIYDDSIMTKVRKPNPVGVLTLIEGKKKYSFSKAEMARWK
jgi:hypothetical protein